MKTRMLVKLNVVVMAVVMMVLGCSGAAQAASDLELFKYRGKTVGSKDLSPAEQQALYEVEVERYGRLKMLVDDAVLSRYFDEQAQKAGKTRAEVEAQLMVGAEPTDKEVEAFYEANKERIPPQMQLEQVKGQIKEHLKVESGKRRRDELATKARREAGVTQLFQEPQAPTLQINIDGFPSRGGKNAKVRVIEFADYQCPHCKAAGEVMAKILKKYGDKIALTFVDFPINHSGISRAIAQGAVCAEQQGKYWEYHELAFAQQKTLTNESPVGLAKELKLDDKKFAACMATPAPEARVAAGKAEGERIGIGGTPTIFVNGQRVAGYDEAVLSEAIDRALKGGA